jgi:hypothetical protein
MRLYLNTDEEILFWDEFCPDPFMTDVTDNKDYRRLAKERGLKEPEVISEVIDDDRPVTKIKTGDHTFADAVIESYKKWERKAADVYPTPVDGTESIMPIIHAMSKAFEETHGRPMKTVWEPCCGDGRLSRVLEHHGFDVISTDIREYSGYGFGPLDFLSETPKAKWGWDSGKPDLIVLNPPFSLSVEFIQRALGYTPWVVCLVKQNYYNTVNRYEFFQELRPNFFLPLTFRLAFLEEERGKSPLMDCAWAVWGPCYDTTECIMEPVKRIKYPGYAKKGLKASTRILEGELFDLTTALENGAASWLVNLKES